MERELRELLLDGARLLGADLSEEGVGRFATYLVLLQRWGGKINLTSRLGSREIVTHHFLDSLAGVGLFSERREIKIIDLGAGAGLPAFPLKFALPEISVTLVESARKKVAFCQEVIRSTSLRDAAAVWARAEQLAGTSEHRSAYHWAVSRALGEAAKVLALAVPFLLPGGRVLLYKGSPETAELHTLDLACREIDASWELRQVKVPYLDEDRSLLVIKTSE